MQIKHFDCECHSPNHTYELVVFEPSKVDRAIYLRFQLNKNFSFFRRLILAFQYVFGYTGIYGVWDEILIKPDDYKHISEIFEKVNKWF